MENRGAPAVAVTVAHEVAAPAPRLPYRVAPRLGARFHHGLTFKQAAVTLGVVLALGALIGVAELYLDWQSRLGAVKSEMRQTLALVRGSAVEAAYQLNPDLARQVVDGLFHNEDVERVTLTDNFGKTLARRADGARQAAGGAGWAARLFEDVAVYELKLTYPRPDGGTDDVGILAVQLSPQAIAARFVRHAATSALFAAVGIAAICTLVVLVFYFMITRPILRVTDAISRADPERPGAWPAPRLRGHDRDEFGTMVGSLDSLLRAFQRGLDERDEAQLQLRALNQDLEAKVADRTRALRQALTDLAGEKAETERAFAQLDEAHQKLGDASQRIVESIRYARRIQLSMLPSQGVLGDALDDLGIHWEPLHVVGGDYFWLERFGDQSLLLIFDCTGHGVPGAFMTLVVASALDRILHEQKLRAPGQILAALDAMVRARLRQDRADADSDDGLEAAACLWDMTRRTVTFSGAGLPLFHGAPGEPLTEIRGDRAALGYCSLPSRGTFTDHVVRVASGHSFYLTTDGAHDQMGGAPRRLLGRRRLTALIALHRDRPMAEQVRLLSEALSDYRGDEPRRDDETVIGFTVA